MAGLEELGVRIVVRPTNTGPVDTLAVAEEAPGVAEASS